MESEYLERIEKEMIRLAMKYPAVEKIIFGDILGFKNHYIFVAGSELDFGDCLYHSLNEELSDLEHDLSNGELINGCTAKIETLFLKSPHFMDKKRIVYER